jgi:hypothetical protein
MYKTMNVKRFIYCAGNDGGMEWNDYLFEDNNISFDDLYGWFWDACVEQDTKLIEWAKTAKIGDFYNHRLGIVFRVNL